VNASPVVDVVILSGGLDSTVCLALARKEGGRPPLALTFDYGQRHRVELERAAAVAQKAAAQHLVVHLDAGAWGGSALTDPSIEVPPGGGSGVPATYVPGRNIIFLAVALSVAEAKGADRVWIGVNHLDYSGYPDCRPQLIEAMRHIARVGQQRGVEGRPIEIRAPLQHLSKAGIVRLGLEVGAPLELTWSCYRGGSVPCGICDACLLRAKGFAEAGEADPALA
jgi:7-cyano-7-deazaguanine synthase